MVKCLTWYSEEFGIWFSRDGAERVSETDTVIVQDRIDVARFSSSSFFFFVLRSELRNYCKKFDVHLIFDVLARCNYHSSVL